MTTLYSFWIIFAKSCQQINSGREYGQEVRLAFKRESVKETGLLLSMLSIYKPSPAWYTLLALEMKAVFPAGFMPHQQSFANLKSVYCKLKNIIPKREFWTPERRKYCFVASKFERWRWFTSPLLMP